MRVSWGVVCLCGKSVAMMTTISSPSHYLQVPGDNLKSRTSFATRSDASHKLLVSRHQLVCVSIHSSALLSGVSHGLASVSWRAMLLLVDSWMCVLPIHCLDVPVRD